MSFSRWPVGTTAIPRLCSIRAPHLLEAICLAFCSKYIIGGVANPVADGTVTLQSPRIYPRQHGDIGIDVVVNPDNALRVVKPMKASYILLQCALPRNWHCQQQCVQTGIVKTLADVGPCACSRIYPTLFLSLFPFGGCSMTAAIRCSTHIDFAALACRGMHLISMCAAASINLIMLRAPHRIDGHRGPFPQTWSPSLRARDRRLSPSEHRPRSRDSQDAAP
jgi:hypothetical protein